MKLFVDLFDFGEFGQGLDGTGLSSDPFSEFASGGVIDLLQFQGLKTADVVLLSPGKDQMIHFKHGKPVLGGEI